MSSPVEFDKTIIEVKSIFASWNLKRDVFQSRNFITSNFIQLCKLQNLIIELLGWGRFFFLILFSFFTTFFLFIFLRFFWFLNHIWNKKSHLAQNVTSRLLFCIEFNGNFSILACLCGLNIFFLDFKCGFLTFLVMRDLHLIIFEVTVTPVPSFCWNAFRWFAHLFNQI